MSDYQYLSRSFNAGILSLSEVRQQWDLLQDFHRAVQLVKDYYGSEPVPVTDCGDFTLAVVPWEA